MKSGPGEQPTALADKVARVYRLLVDEYGIPPWKPSGDALGELIATILSQHTSDVNSERAYAELVRRLPTWEAVRDAPVEAVEGAIRSGGLAHQKAERIQRILRAIPTEADGKLALAGLKETPLEKALAYLEALPGVGPKTAACVLLFAVGQPAFPVDTHVWRVSQRLGLIGPKVTPEAAHDVLRSLIPPEWRYTMHVDMIRLGRQICHAQRPEHSRCPLRSECPYYWAIVAAER